MRHFTNVHDLGDLNAAVKEALEVKSNRFAYKHLGQNKTLMMNKRNQMQVVHKRQL